MKTIVALVVTLAFASALVAQQSKPPAKPVQKEVDQSNPFDVAAEAEETKAAESKQCDLYRLESNQRIVLLVNVADGSYLHRARELVISENLLSAALTVKVTSFDGIYRPDAPETSEWTIRKTLVVPRAQFYAIVSQGRVPEQTAAK